MPKNRALNVLFIFKCAVFGGECGEWWGIVGREILYIVWKVGEVFRCGGITDLSSYLILVSKLDNRWNFKGLGDCGKNLDREILRDGLGISCVLAVV